MELGPLWTSAENLAPTGIRFPERPGRSVFVYLLRYPGPQRKLVCIKHYYNFYIYTAFVFSM